MNIKITKPRNKDGWIKGTVGKYEFEAKVYDEGSMYGIEQGRVSKLSIYTSENRHCIVNYDRGWDVYPTSWEERGILNDVLIFLEELPTGK